MPALIPIGAAIVGGVIANKGARDAANAQAGAVDRANETQLTASREAQAFQQKQYDQARADNEPWRQAGIGALNKLGAAPDFSYTGENMLSDPGYQFGLSEGMRGMTNSAAARGGLLSGAALKAASRYNNDYASTKFGEGFSRALQTDNTNKNRLASLAGIGQVSASQTNALGGSMGANVGNGMMNTAGQIGQNQIGAGNARASSYIAQGNALTGAINQGVSAWRNGMQPPSYGNFSEGATNQTGNFNTYGAMFSP